MIVFLVLPGTLAAGRMKLMRIRLRLVHDPENRRKHKLYGRDGAPFDDSGFRRMRAERGAWIETDAPASVCQALRIGRPEDEPGIHVLRLKR